MHILKQYIVQVIRIIDQCCRYNKLTWHMHGRLVRMMLSGSMNVEHDNNPLEFVILPPCIPYSINVVETLTTNLRVNGFTLETQRQGYSALNGMFHVHGVDNKIMIILTDKFPTSLYTCDDIVLDAYGITLKSLSPTKDETNMCKGVGMIDRILALQDSEVVASEMLIPHNKYKAHKEHNIVMLRSLNTATSDGFKVSQVNIELHQSEAYECPVCMENGKCCSRLACGHTFCLNCLEKILSTENLPRCSLCRCELVFTM